MEKKQGFWFWLFWALGIRTLRADGAYGERLRRYRSWSAKPVMVLSLLTLVLVLTKIGMLTTAFVKAFGALDPATVVASHDLNTSVLALTFTTMEGLLRSLEGVFPGYLELILLTSWFLAFVLDFLLCLHLADNRKAWFGAHWGGIITAVLTAP